MSYKFPRNKGITLIELLVYMSLFAILIIILFSTVFYIQQIFSNKKVESVMRIQVYEHLHLLQQYTEKAEKVHLATSSVTLYMYVSTDPVALQSISQYIEEGSLVLEYIYNESSLSKKIYPYELTRFEEFTFQKINTANELLTVSRQGLIEARAIWKNPKQKLISLHEVIYIPNNP